MASLIFKIFIRLIKTNKSATLRLSNINVHNENLAGHEHIIDLVIWDVTENCYARTSSQYSKELIDVTLVMCNKDAQFLWRPDRWSRLYLRDHNTLFSCLEQCFESIAYHGNDKHNTNCFDDPLHMNVDNLT